MNASCYIHLPGIKADFEGIHPLCIGCLAHPDFDTWHALDGTFANCESKYKRNRPLFFVAHQTDEAAGQELTAKEIIDRFDHLRNIVSWAAVLAFTATIPSPFMSCSYYALDGLSPHRVIGPFEREWIVFCDYCRKSADKPALVGFNRIMLFLYNSEYFTQSTMIMRGLGTMVFTSSPEFFYRKNSLNYFNVFVHQAAALEYLLVPENVTVNYGMTITESFGKNWAALSRNNFSDIDVWAPYFSEMYRLRSKIMHGEAHSENYTERVRQAMEITRAEFSEIVLKFVALNNTAFNLDSLPEMLMEAARKEDVHRQLHERIAKGGL